MGQEIDHDFLAGNALLYNTDNGQSWQYNAIARQALQINPDGVLDLDGVEYTQATNQIVFDGFAGNFYNVNGTLAVADISCGPGIDINLTCWNQNEVPSSRHLGLNMFAQYDQIGHLNLSINQVFTPKIQCIAASQQPLWAVFYQNIDGFAWGGSVRLNQRAGVSISIRP
jgi:hypothetical protein